MAVNLRWPIVGEKLFHRVKGDQKPIEATVVAVDLAAKKIAVSVDGTEFSSLSAAARAVSGGVRNGWVFWGLKTGSLIKQTSPNNVLTK